MKILVLDNYDSFVFNLVQYIAQLGGEPVVVRSDQVSIDDAGAQQLIAQHRPDGVLISPGPGTPSTAGVSVPMVDVCARLKLPLFGVCLGHQAIGEVYGGAIGHAPELLHGKTSAVEHDGTGVLAGLPSPFIATRYHSLVVQEAGLSAEMIVTARTASGVVMGMRHTSLPIDAVQFHPEAILTEHGYRIVANWLDSIEALGAADLAAALDAGLDQVRAEAKFSLA